jgi:hypothetical protein
MQEHLGWSSENPNSPIFNISVVEWEAHTSESIEKLKVALDKEFEYEDNELSTIGLKMW